MLEGLGGVVRGRGEGGNSSRRELERRAGEQGRRGERGWGKERGGAQGRAKTKVTASARERARDAPVRMPVTSAPPWQQLLIMDFMGTVWGSTARISAVGASNLGFTSTK